MLDKERIDGREKRKQNEDETFFCYPRQHLIPYKGNCVTLTQYLIATRLSKTYAFSF